MAKVTVYVTDEQLEKLKAAKGVGRGGVSKMFQSFIESLVGGGGSDAVARYDYARKLMPTHAAIERHRRRLAAKVQAGGPPADGGPVAAALTILLYRRLLEADPSLEAAFEKEFARFGLDELVASETEGVDLLAEPEDDEWEISDDAFADVIPGGIPGLAGMGVHIGDEIRTALDQVRWLRGLKEQEVRSMRPRPRGRKGVVVEVSADDDPRDVLSVTDFETFSRRHTDWDAGMKLTPSQMETMRELLIRRAGGDPDREEDEGTAETPSESDE